MTELNPDSQPPESSGYGIGVILGSLLGGVSLFLLGTKTGQKIVTELKKESTLEGFNFKEIQAKTDEKIKHFLSTIPLTDYLKTLFPKESKTSPVKVTSKDIKDKKNFFFKRGKKLG